MTDVFGQNKEENEATGIEAFVGQDKKYKTEQDALNAIPFQQAHIEKLESELAGLRSDLDKKLGAEEILNKFQEQQQARQTDVGAMQSQDQGDSNDASSQNSVSTDESIRGVVEQMEKEKLVNANRQEANDFMISTFGDKATTTVQDKANALGMSVAQLQAIAENSPAAFKSLINGGAKQQEDVVATTATSQGMDANSRTAGVPDHGTNAYYENLRKTDPKTYWLPATQNALHKAALADRNKFFGN